MSPSFLFFPAATGGMFKQMKYSVSAGFCMLLIVVAFSGAAERINHEGRILGPSPVVTNAVLFNTAQADAILSAMQIFPVTNAWNEDISRLPLLPDSDAMVAQISADLAANRRTLRAFQEMNFVLVPDSQPPIPVSFVLYPEDSDPGPYPIPSNLPVETWPTGTTGLSLSDWQQDLTDVGGDRHAIIVQPGTGGLFEMWQAKRVGTSWQASNGAKFDLNSNALRPAGWTSADAAGLAMFGALPRYDECERGTVEHACRLVVYRTRREYLYPATHFASSTPATQTNVPAMGQRLRLKSGFAVPDSWTKQEKAVLRALKKYGAIVADNGGFFSISVTPDDRWPAGAFDHLGTVGITNFEVVRTTGPLEGPRSAGAPRADAGADKAVAVGAPVSLDGFVSFTGAQPTVRWSLYSGPGSAAFADSTRTNTAVTFSAPGTYTFLLSASDDVHAVAYDAVVVTAAQPLNVAISHADSQVTLNWTGGLPPYVVERAETLSVTAWNPVATNSSHTLLLPSVGTSAFFRVRTL